jgi:hypothetical protein
LITLEKLRVFDVNGQEKHWEAPDFLPLESEFAATSLKDDDVLPEGQDETARRQTKLPGHAFFREKYLAGFPSASTSPASQD